MLYTALGTSYNLKNISNLEILGPFKILKSQNSSHSHLCTLIVNVYSHNVPDTRLSTLCALFHSGLLTTL